MLVLTIVACLGGADCRHFELLYDPYDVSLMSCMVTGQREIARWKRGNPRWSVERWSCGYQDLSEVSA